MDARSASVRALKIQISIFLRDLGSSPLTVIAGSPTSTLEKNSLLASVWTLICGNNAHSASKRRVGSREVQADSHGIAKDVGIVATFANTVSVISVPTNYDYSCTRAGTFEQGTSVMLRESTRLIYLHVEARARAIDTVTVTFNE